MKYITAHQECHEGICSSRRISYEFRHASEKRRSVIVEGVTIFPQKHIFRQQKNWIPER